MIKIINNIFFLIFNVCKFVVNCYSDIIFLESNVNFNMYEELEFCLYFKNYLVLFRWRYYLKYENKFFVSVSIGILFIIGENEIIWMCNCGELGDRIVIYLFSGIFWSR